VSTATTKHEHFSTRKNYEKSEPVDFNRMAINFQKDTMAKTAKARGPRAFSHIERTNLFKSRMITEKPCNRQSANLISCADEPMIDAKLMKSNFLRGDGETLYYYDRNELNPSNY
jgi:hypothetical protein